MTLELVLLLQVQRTELHACTGAGSNLQSQVQGGVMHAPAVSGMQNICMSCVASDPTENVHVAQIVTLVMPTS